MRRRTLLACLPLAGCVSVELGGENAAPLQLALRDTPAQGPVRLPTPLVDALLIQSLPAGGQVDTTAIAYSRRPGEYLFYQLATWTERPVRQLPRLLAQRLEARGVTGAAGLLGDPLRADWLLTVGLHELVHDISSAPGLARVAYDMALIDRRTRRRTAQRQVQATAPVASADAPAAARALSVAVGNSFDQALPWLEAQLMRGMAGAANSAG